MFMMDKKIFDTRRVSIDIFKIKLDFFSIFKDTLTLNIFSVILVLKFVS